MQTLGLDGLRYLETGDPVEQLLMVAIAQKVVQHRREEHLALAAAIVNTLGKALK